MQSHILLDLKELQRNPVTVGYAFLPSQYTIFIVSAKNPMAFIEQEAIERPDGQDLGMPVMNADTIRLCYFRYRKAFHASST